jgi:hypothetical protein
MIESLAKDCLKEHKMNENNNVIGKLVKAVEIAKEDKMTTKRLTYQSRWPANPLGCSLEKIQKEKEPSVGDNYHFALSPHFLDDFSNPAVRKPPFGFDGVGEVTYRRTYSRVKTDGKNEEWWETVNRVVCGTYTMQHRRIEERNMEDMTHGGAQWDESKAQRSAEEMYDRMFHMKFLPPGRGLWAMGTRITEELGLFEALNNCAFVSTKDLSSDHVNPFRFLMHMSMCGVGVGFDTKGEGSFVIPGPDELVPTKPYEIPDSREGWVNSTMYLITAFFYQRPLPEFSYEKIRAKGVPLKTFGGVAPGPEPLMELHRKLTDLLDSRVGDYISSETIVDIFNLIGACVASGGVRRTAEIALGAIDDEAFLNLKDFSLPRAAWGWVSNNSVVVEPHKRNTYEYYLPATLRTYENGEPGFFWLKNAQRWGRMSGNENLDGIREPLACGTNPCGEQTLEHMELCNLVEICMNRHTCKEDFLRTGKYAFLYAKTVTTGKTSWGETNKVIERNRRIGCSLTGISQFVHKYGEEVLIEWVEALYCAIRGWDRTFSFWFGIPQSIKVTSIKPSGTVSLLAGATPGMHWPIANYHLRRIRFHDSSPMLKTLKEAGYPIEKDLMNPANMVVTFPVSGDDTMTVESQVSMEQQFERVILLQKHYSDNQVSVTIKFPKTPSIEAIKKYSTLLLDTKSVAELRNLLGPHFIHHSDDEIQEMFMIYCKADMDYKDNVFDYPPSYGMYNKAWMPHLIPVDESSYDESSYDERIENERNAFHKLIVSTHIADLLSRYQYCLKCISLLPMDQGKTVYAQAPYEAITKDEYDELRKTIKPITSWEIMPQPEAPFGCEGESCMIKSSLGTSYS